MTDTQPPRSRVDLSDAMRTARTEADRAETGDPYGEAMATYVQLGELLESGRSVADYVQECQDLVQRVLDLERAMRRYNAGQIALGGGA